MRKVRKDGARLASSGREFQSLGAATEKVLSWVPTLSACERRVGPRGRPSLMRLIKGVAVL